VIGKAFDILDAGRLAEAALRERKVHADDQGFDIRHSGGFFIKPAGFRVTYRRIEGGDGNDEPRFAFARGQGHRR